jgi:hypothetical protein
VALGLPQCVSIKRVFDKMCIKDIDDCEQAQRNHMIIQAEEHNKVDHIKVKLEPACVD